MVLGDEVTGRWRGGLKAGIQIVSNTGRRWGFRTLLKQSRGLQQCDWGWLVEDK